ncbi:MAG: methyltransferase domain-containing protein [Anaerolineales bacterium]
MPTTASLRDSFRLFLFWLYIQFHRYLHRIKVLPYSRHFGAERGSPVGRYYVEKFLRAHADNIMGRCLEFGQDRYRTYFPKAIEYDVTDVVERPGVRYVCDIHDPVGMPKDHFDAIICTQVFEHLASPEKAAHALYKLMAPGGVLLLTAPFINQVHYDPTDFRRFTPDGLEMIIKEAGFDIEIVTFGGNSLVGTGSLLGMVQEDFSTHELEIMDPVYPYNILVKAKKPLLNG